MPCDHKAGHKSWEMYPFNATCRWNNKNKKVKVTEQTWKNYVKLKETNPLLFANNDCLKLLENKIELNKIKFRPLQGRYIKKFFKWKKESKSFDQNVCTET